MNQVSSFLLVRLDQLKRHHVGAARRERSYPALNRHTGTYERAARGI